jgi:Dolichyl-phosphate-mannose-protein mannosyltransferase
MAAEDVALARRATGASTARARRRLALPRWSGPAWGAIGVTLLFVAITCWWLSQDRSVQIFDAGTDLNVAFTVHDMFRAGDLFGPLSINYQYPSFAFQVGGLAAMIGGVNVASPILGENLVFGSLLALGCYQVGRLAYGPRAGLLAVVFALGSPLLIEQFHVFLLEVPEAGLMAVAVWLTLASGRFERVGISALAGLAVGCGVATKEQFPLYIAGFLVVAVVRGRGSRNWRGLFAFSAVALVVASPWYIVHLSDLGSFAHTAGAIGIVPPLSKPPLISLGNLTWYFWNLLNAQLFAVLFVFAAVGFLWAVVVLVRRRDPGGWTPELVGGGVGAWLALSAMPHHETRYTIPMTIYIAVLGTAWIVRLPRVASMLATAVLGLAVVATTLGASFGVGKPVIVKLPGYPSASYARPSMTTTSSSEDRSGTVRCFTCSVRCAGTG